MDPDPTRKEDQPVTLSDLRRLADHTLIAGLPADLAAAVRAAVDRGASAREAVRRVLLTRPAVRQRSYTALAIEALAERLVAARESQRN
jgi:hypothetical protein